MEIIEIAAVLFDGVVVAVIRNPGKGEPLFSLQERQDQVGEVCGHLDNVRVVAMSKLTVDVARDEGADVIVKGLRVASDFEHELQMAQMNEAISGIQTVFLPCASTHSFVNSTLLREISKYGGSDRVKAMVPDPVAKRLAERFKA